MHELRFGFIFTPELTVSIVRHLKPMILFTNGFVGIYRGFTNRPPVPLCVQPVSEGTWFNTRYQLTAPPPEKKNSLIEANSGYLSDATDLFLPFLDYLIAFLCLFSHPQCLRGTRGSILISLCVAKS